MAQSRSPPGHVVVGLEEVFTGAAEANQVAECGDVVELPAHTHLTLPTGHFVVGSVEGVSITAAAE